MVEGELHLGMIGLPAASVWLSTGLELSFLYATKDTKDGPNAAARRLADRAPALWDLVTNVDLRYYFWRLSWTDDLHVAATTSDIGQPARPDEKDLVERAEILDAVAMARVVRRMAFEILERDGAEAYFVGIRTGGAFLAERMVRMLAEAGEARPTLGAVDITLYRDDVFLGLPKPEVGPTELPDSDRRAHGGAGGRRALHRAHGARGHGRAGRLRPARGRCSWRPWSTGAGASCPSSPTTSACGCRPGASIGAGDAEREGRNRPGGAARADGPTMSPSAAAFPTATCWAPRGCRRGRS